MLNLHLNFRRLRLTSRVFSRVLLVVSGELHHKVICNVDRIKIHGTYVPLSHHTCSLEPPEIQQAIAYLSCVDERKVFVELNFLGTEA